MDKPFILTIYKPLISTRKTHPAEHNLLEEIYSWSPRVDIWDAIRDEGERTRLHELVIGSFRSEIPIEKRNCEKLKPIINKIGETLNPDRWIHAKDDPEDDVSVLIDPLLALVHHLRWIYETFKDVNELSILIR